MTWQKPGKRRKVKEILRKNKLDIAGSLINQGFPFLRAGSCPVVNVQ